MTYKKSRLARDKSSLRRMLEGRTSFVLPSIGCHQMVRTRFTTCTVVEVAVDELDLEYM